MSEIAAMPVQPLQSEYIGGHRAAEGAAIEAAQSSWRSRIGQIAGRAALALGIAGGMTGVGIAEAAPAEASSATCYGDYCSGQYANETGCDEDAETLATAVIEQSGVNLNIQASADPSVSVSTGEQSEIGTLELRHSEKCGTNWTRLNTKGGNSVGMRGINFIGVQQDGGYTQKRDVGGLFNGSPAAISFTPMIYGRNRTYRAFVESKDYAIAYQDGTYWMAS